MTPAPIEPWDVSHVTNSTSSHPPVPLPLPPFPFPPVPLSPFPPSSPFQPQSDAEEEGTWSRSATGLHALAGAPSPKTLRRPTNLVAPAETPHISHEEAQRAIQSVAAAAAAATRGIRDPRPEAGAGAATAQRMPPRSATFSGATSSGISKGGVDATETRPPPPQAPAPAPVSDGQHANGAAHAMTSAADYSTLPDGLKSPKGRRAKRQEQRAERIRLLSVGSSPRRRADSQGESRGPISGYIEPDMEPELATFASPAAAGSATNEAAAFSAPAPAVSAFAAPARKASGGGGRKKPSDAALAPPPPPPPPPAAGFLRLSSSTTRTTAVDDNVLERSSKPPPPPRRDSRSMPSSPTAMRRFPAPPAGPVTGGESQQPPPAAVFGGSGMLAELQNAKLRSAEEQPERPQLPPAAPADPLAGILDVKLRKVARDAAKVGGGIAAKLPSANGRLRQQRRRPLGPALSLCLAFSCHPFNASQPFNPPFFSFSPLFYFLSEGKRRGGGAGNARESTGERLRPAEDRQSPLGH